MKKLLLVALLVAVSFSLTSCNNGSGESATVYRFLPMLSSNINTVKFQADKTLLGGTYYPEDNVTVAELGTRGSGSWNSPSDNNTGTVAQLKAKKERIGEMVEKYLTDENQILYIFDTGFTEYPLYIVWHNSKGTKVEL